MHPLDWPPAWDHRIKRYLQLGGQDQAETRAQAIWLEALDLAQPECWHDIIPMNEFLQMFAPYAQASQALQRLLEDCGQVALMTVSLGAQIEELAKKLFARHEAFAGFMLDRMGSYLAEWCMSSLDQKLTQSLEARDLRATRRYSPGYKDFSLEAQKVFVELAGHAIPGLKLGPGNLLLPEKSITAVKGVSSSP